MRIGEGFDRACQVAVKHLETIADSVEFSKANTEVSYCTGYTIIYHVRDWNVVLAVVALTQRFSVTFELKYYEKGIWVKTIFISQSD